MGEGWFYGCDCSSEPRAPDEGLGCAGSAEGSDFAQMFDRARVLSIIPPHQLMSLRRARHQDPRAPTHLSDHPTGAAAFTLPPPHLIQRFPHADPSTFCCHKTWACRNPPPKKVSPFCTRLSPRLPFSMEICSFFPPRTNPAQHRVWLELPRSPSAPRHQSISGLSVTSASWKRVSIPRGGDLI